MATRAEQIFVNLPVKDLNRSIDFFTSIGFEFNAQFTDQNATCMVVSDNIFVMLLVEDYFRTFSNKPVVDAAASSEVIVALSASSKESVNEIVKKALAAGAKASKDPVDHGFMYSWSFQDLDGHLWEFIYMDANAVQ